jgi:hypothetical protein
MLDIFHRTGHYLSVSDWDNEFEVIVNRFLEVLGWMGGSLEIHSRINKGQIHLVDADEDEEFTYGALCAALAQLGGNEHEWLLAHEFGNFYSLRHTDYALTNDE